MVLWKHPISIMFNYKHETEEEAGNTLRFLKPFKSTPSATSTPIKVYFLILLKNFHQMGTKHANICYMLLFKPSQRAKSYLNDFEYIVPKINYSLVWHIFIIQHIVIDHQDAKSNQEYVLICSFIYSHLSYKKGQIVNYTE